VICLGLSFGVLARYRGSAALSGEVSSECTFDPFHDWSNFHGYKRLMIVAVLDEHTAQSGTASLVLGIDRRSGLP
jgi:hypothetical protein